MRKNTLKIIPIVILLLLATAITVNAIPEGIQVLVLGKAVVADGDYLKNDIVVSGKIFISTTETEVKVKVDIEVTGPDGSDSQKMTLYGSGDGSKDMVIYYGTTFHDIVTIKGMYEITVTATCEGMEDTGTHQFDPPGGGAGPPLR
ncbi:MAG: hypothetical protein NWE88_03025 [Candidatus Bathyarchaeota archaeon]|nr:hypothetical protein [Candidatus Bathyarchaeota archaeon]